jgi:hypothetical protein
MGVRSAHLGQPSISQGVAASRTPWWLSVFAVGTFELQRGRYAGPRAGDRSTTSGHTSFERHDNDDDDVEVRTRAPRHQVYATASGRLARSHQYGPANHASARGSRTAVRLPLGTQLTHGRRMSARSLLSRATSPGGATAELARCDTAGSLERLGEGELVVAADLVATLPMRSPCSSRSATVMRHRVT